MNKSVIVSAVLGAVLFSGCFWDKEPKTVVIKKVPVPAACTTEVYQLRTNPNVIYPVTMDCCGSECQTSKPTIKWDSYRYDKCDNCY